MSEGKKIPTELANKLRAIRERTDTERGVTPEEAANNAAILSRLLAKHNLSIDDLSVIGTEGRIVDEFLNDEEDKAWKRYLMFHLANNNLCEVIWYENHGYILVGQPENIVVVKEMYAWLVEELPKMAWEALEKAMVQPAHVVMDEKASFSQYIRLSHEYDEAYRSWNTATRNPSKWRSDFIHGAIDGLKEKMQSERRKQVSEDRANALVPILEKEVRDYVQDKFENVKPTEVKNQSNPTVYFEGKRAGRSISLDKQVRDAESSTERQLN